MMPSGVRTAEQDITIAVAWHGAAVELAVSGELDSTTTPLLEEALRHAAGEGPAALVVNLTAVEFLASAGISALIKAYAELGPPFAVVATGDVVLRPLTITGLDRVLPLHPSLAAALTALAPR